MIFNRINKIHNPHHRRAIYGALSLHGIFLSLVGIKTLVFNIAGLKAFAYGSVLLMSVFNMIPHIALADAEPEIDYSISNSVYPMFIEKEEYAIYMLYWQNDSNPYTAGSNVTVAFDIPEGMTYVSNEGPTYTRLTDEKIIWKIDNANSRKGMIILRLLVDPDTVGRLKATATVSSANVDPERSNNKPDAFILANGGEKGDVNLRVYTTIDDDSINVTDGTTMKASIFDNIDFKIHYINEGPDKAVGVKLYDVLPPELRKRTISTPKSDVSLSRENNMYVRDIGTLQAGESGFVSISASIFPIIKDGNVFSNTAIISSNIADADGIDNTSVFSIQVQDTQPDIYVDIFAPKQTICIGEDLKFTVNLGNQGLGTANNISLKHTKPNTVQYVGSSKDYAGQVVGGVYNRKYATPFSVGDSTSFTMTLKGYAPGTAQSIPIVVYNNNEQVAQDSFAVTVLPDTASVCGGGDDPDPVYGCTDKKASNYSTGAEVDNNTCKYNDPDIKYGCMDEDANNYDEDATVDNDTCDFPQEDTPIPGCMDVKATNYNKKATVNDKSCLFINPVYGCKNKEATNYDSKVTVDNGTCTVPDTTTTTGSDSQTGDKKEEDSKDIIIGRPSPINFFVTNPLPKVKTRKPVAEVKKLIEKVSLAKTPEQIAEDKTFEKQLLEAVKCEETMVEVYNYANDMGLITKYDIKDLCAPITRIKFAGIMVKYILEIALVEPKLERNCVFSDLTTQTNEEKFNASLACDFGIMGVDDDGRVSDTFNPNKMLTKAVAAKALTRFVFGDDIQKKAPAGQAWYAPSLKILQESYVMRDIANPQEELFLGHLLLMLKRTDFGELILNSKFIRVRNAEN